MNTATNISHPIDLATLDQEIRPFPATATKIVTLCNSSETKITEITQLIECEPAVAIKLLSMANSPLFGARREITSVNHAIVLLGYKTVASLALTIAAGPLFTTGNDALMGHRKALFAQSVGVAAVSKLVAEKFALAEPSEAFLGGMMLDVGKLFLFDVVPEPYTEILKTYKNKDTVDVELEMFGTDHPTIGNHCGQKWGLPNQINTVIQNHHAGLEQTEDSLTRTVIAGIYFSNKWKLGFDDKMEFPICENMESKFGDLNVADLQEAAQQQFETIISIFEE